MTPDDSIITELDEETGEWEIVPQADEESALDSMIERMDDNG